MLLTNKQKWEHQWIRISGRSFLILSSNLRCILTDFISCRRNYYSPFTESGNISSAEQLNLPFPFSFFFSSFLFHFHFHFVCMCERASERACILFLTSLVLTRRSCVFIWWSLSLLVHAICFIFHIHVRTIVSVKLFIWHLQI